MEHAPPQGFTPPVQLYKLPNPLNGDQIVLIVANRVDINSCDSSYAFSLASLKSSMMGDIVKLVSLTIIIISYTRIATYKIVMFIFFHRRRMLSHDIEDVDALREEHGSSSENYPLLNWGTEFVELKECSQKYKQSFKQAQKVSIMKEGDGYFNLQ